MVDKHVSSEIWPMLTFGPVNLWSLPAAWKCFDGEESITHVKEPPSMVVDDNDVLRHE